MKRMISAILAVLMIVSLLPMPAQAATTGHPDYPNNPPAEVDTVKEKVDWIAQKCRETGLTEDWDIALWLHDWLIYNADYDHTFTYYDPDGVLLKGTGVCDSYTKAYMLLLNEFNIENKYLASDGMNHAWNLVKIDGEWCHIDCTWDDPGAGDREIHPYFGLTDKLMSRDHTWETDSYPACTSMINYYPIRMGFDTFETKEEWLEILDQSAANRVETIVPYYIGDESVSDIQNWFYDWFDANYRKYHLNGYRLTGGAGLQFGLRYMDGHDYYLQEWVNPTCTEPGYIKYECGCGEYYIDEGSYVEPWGHNFEHGICTSCGATGLPGDMDDNQTVDVDDVLALLWHVLFPEEYPIEVEADFDGSGTTDVDDVLTLLWHVLFPEEYPLEQKPAEPSVMGTVIANNLNVREEPVTSSKIVARLAEGTRVEILSQKEENGVTWGQIAEGWINMNYVQLDTE